MRINYFFAALAATVIRGENPSEALRFTDVKQKKDKKKKKQSKIDVRK